MTYKDVVRIQPTPRPLAGTWEYEHGNGEILKCF